MCEPVSMGLMMAAGTAVSAVGSVMQGNTAKAMGELQQQAYNVQAENTRKAASFEALQSLHKSELQQAEARAKVGASGVAFAGSPTEVVVANAGQNQLDVEAIKWGSDVKANQLTTQGNFAKWSGDRAQTAGYLSGASTLFSGAGRAIQMGKSPFSTNNNSLFS